MSVASPRLAEGAEPTSDDNQSEADVERVMSIRGRRIPAEVRRRISTSILEASAEHRIDPMLVLAVIEVESSFRTRAKSPRGALGLMQLLPETGRYVARKLGLSRQVRRDSALYDPALNVRLGVLYLRRLTDFFDGDLTLALTAYCYGPFRVQRVVAERGAVPARWLSYARAVERARARHERAIRVVPRA